MAQRQASLTRLASPLRAALQRFAFVLLIIAAFALMILGKADAVIVERVRTALSDAVTPVMDVVSQPVSSVRNFVDSMEGLAALQAENARLRAENARLQGWEAAARRMEQENAALKGFLNLTTREDVEFVSARVVADAGSAFVRSRLINAGTRDGVAAGQAVMTGEGLAGRIVQAGDLSARVLLVTDLNSRIPVMIETTRISAILAGDNSPRPRLVLLPAGAEVPVGARVVTSGHAAAFPPGLPVGIVAANEDGILRIEPAADLARMEYVRVIDYDLEGILRTVDEPAAAGARE